MALGAQAVAAWNADQSREYWPTDRVVMMIEYECDMRTHTRCDLQTHVSVKPAEQVILGNRNTFLVPKQKLFWPILTLLWIICLVYMHSSLMRGWIPHDEGSLGHAAERVMQGELPHRDFDDIYTGGLAMLNAVAFRTLGMELTSLRWFLFIIFAAWVPAVYYIATRFASAMAAGTVTLLAAAWSVPNYAAALPSWYNLFFATFGIAAILRYLATPRSSWLFLSGLCGGLSVLAKVSGSYYISAAVLFFVFAEQEIAMEHRGDNKASKLGLYSLFVFAGSLGFLLLLMKTLNWTPPGERIVHFVLPSLGLVVLLLYREGGIKLNSNLHRFSTLMQMLLPFLAGVLIPVLIFLIPYIDTGSLHSVFEGVFVLPLANV